MVLQNHRKSWHRC